MNNSYNSFVDRRKPELLWKMANSSGVRDYVAITKEPEENSSKKIAVSQTR